LYQSHTCADHILLLASVQAKGKAAGRAGGSADQGTVWPDAVHRQQRCFCTPITAHLLRCVVQMLVQRHDLRQLQLQGPVQRVE